MSPVAIPAIPKDARAAAMRLATSTAEANARLEASREWYLQLQKAYAHP